MKQLDEIDPGIVARGSVAVDRGHVLEVDEFVKIQRDLEAEVKRIITLPTKAERAAGVAEFGVDHRQRLVMLHREVPNVVDAIFVRLGGGPGLDKAARELKNSIVKESKGVAFSLHHGGRDSLSTTNFVTEIEGVRHVFAVPERYACSERGVTEFVQTGQNGVTDRKVTHRPIVITRSFRELNGSASWVEVSWANTTAGWTSRRVSRAAISSARELVALAAFGAPVHSENAAQIVRWLAEFESANPSTASATVSTRCGWQHGTRDFLVGAEHVARPGAEPVELFTDDDPGLEQVARAFRPSGTWQGWLDALEGVSDQPVPWAVLYASCAAPLLEVLGAPNFILDVHGVSGHGKTTVLRLGASVWGSPEDGRAIYSWAATPTAIERTLGALSGMAVCLDESNRVPLRDRPQIASIAYMIGNGSGKARGTIKGTQRRIEFRTVVLSTGEASISSYTEDEGVRGRCLPVYGAPLANAEQAEALRVALGMHHGHLGLRLVRFLVDQSEAGFSDLQDRYEVAKATFAGSGDPMVRRGAQYLAAMWVGAHVAHELGVPKPRCSVWAFMREQVKFGATAADRPLSAARDLFGWALASGRIAQSQAEREPPPGGWLGRFECPETWRWVALVPDAVKGWLKTHGHEPEAILRQWADRGVVLGSTGHLTVPIRLPGQGFASRLLKFDRAKLEEHGILSKSDDG